jgi:hypothetical protein
MVIYELPTAWVQIGPDGVHECGVGTFRDVQALIENAAAARTSARLV